MAKKITKKEVKPVEEPKVCVDCSTCVEVSKYDSDNVFQCGDKILTREEYEKVCK